MNISQLIFTVTHSYQLFSRIRFILKFKCIIFYLLFHAVIETSLNKHLAMLLTDNFYKTRVAFTPLKLTLLFLYFEWIFYLLKKN
jgi:hypothetical protein